MTRQDKNKFSLTTSGFEYDQDLSKVTIKVIPALQALISNQHEMAETLIEHFPEKKIFVETHLAELAMVEESIANSYAKYRKRREDAQKTKQEKANLAKIREESEVIASYYDGPLPETEVYLEQTANKLSPGLPSSKFEQASWAETPKKPVEIRRIAIGAAIKALSNFLRRPLTNQEIQDVEEQVDTYL